MTDRVAEWIKQAKKRNGTKLACVDELNKECGTDIPLKSLNSMETGNRNVPDSIRRKMLVDVLKVELANMPSYKRKKLIAKLLLPVRVK